MVKHTERVTGADGIITLGQDQEIAVSNVSFSIEPQTTNVRSNDSLKPVHATTGIEYNGSFEYDGEQDVIRDMLFYSFGDTDSNGNTVDESNTSAIEPGEPKRVKMSVEEKAPGDGTNSGNLPRKWRIEGLVVTSMSRDGPADDVISTSWDFDAEDIYRVGSRKSA